MIFSSAALWVAGFLSSYFAAALTDMGPPGVGMNVWS
jgi:hypothetical protein